MTDPTVIGGLYGSGFIDFLYNEMELGTRVAIWIDEEDCWGGMAWLMDIHAEEYFRSLGYEK